MIYLIGLWGNVLPGLLLLLLVWRVAERFEPGYGVAAAVALGLGTMVLPLSTLLFSHVFTAFLSFAAFSLMLRERDGPPSPTAAGARRAGDGLRGHLGVPAVLRRRVVLGLFLLSRRDALTPAADRRAAPAPTSPAGSSGSSRCCSTTTTRFTPGRTSPTPTCPRQQKGFFGIGAPSLKVLSTLLLDSRGLLTISPVLIMGAIGTVLLYRRGRRAEALTIGGICLCYLGYNSGYYLPFGGGFMGPRFLDHDAAVPGLPDRARAQALPRPDDRARGGLDHDDRDRHDHPSAGRLRERDGRVDALPLQGLLPADDRLRLRPRARLGRRSGRSCWPPAAASCSRPRGRRRACGCRTRRSARACSRSLAWALFAALAPTLLGIDHAGLQSIVKARRPHGAQPDAARRQQLPADARSPRSPLAAGLLALGAMRLLRNEPDAPPRARADPESRSQPALTG